MNLEIFKRSKKLREALEIECLKARLRNSELPGVATRYVRICEDDPWCYLFVRGRNPNLISPWQKRVLEELLDQGGLAAAIEEGMDDYVGELDSPGGAWSHLTAESLKELQEFGIAACVAVCEVIIDEIQQEVILGCRTEIDGYLTEHGIAIHRSEARWTYDESNYFVDYEERVQTEALAEFNRRWDKLFPESEPPAAPHKGVAFLVGQWVFDPIASKKVMKQLSRGGADINIIVLQSAGAKWTFSSESVEFMLPQFGIHNVAALLGCDRKGSRVVVRSQLAGQAPATSEFGLLEDVLVDRQGRAMRRATVS